MNRSMTTSVNSMAEYYDPGIGGVPAAVPLRREALGWRPRTGLELLSSRESEYLIRLNQWVKNK